MKIASMSDLHGSLSHVAPECDVLALVGDLVPLYSSAEDWKQWRELHWVEHKLTRWLKRQPFERCLISWGNHDIVACAPDTRQIVTECLNSIEGVTVLDYDTPSIMIEGVRFSGHPYTPTIQQRNWAFSLPRGDERVGWALDHFVHPQTDVLLSHGPPMGFLDEKERYGCAMLTKKVIEVAPALVLCGHIHECRGMRTQMWNSKGRITKVVNVSIMDADYSAKGGKVQVVDLGA